MFDMGSRDLRDYFKGAVSSSSSSAGENAVVNPIITSASGSIREAELSMVSEQVQKASNPSRPRKFKYNNVPEKIKIKVGEYAFIHGTKAAIDYFTKLYPHHNFVRTSVNNWKKKVKDKQLEGKKGKGRPNMLEEHLLNKVKDIIVGTRAAGGVISRRMVIAIGTGVVKANNPDILKEFGGPVELTEGWARSVLKSLNFSKRKGTTGKVDPSDQFLKEEKRTFQANIANAVVEHDIPDDLVINLDQTPLSYVSPGKYTMHQRGATNVPINGLDDKRQVTGTFAVSMTGNFLPVQVIYQGKTKRCLPKYTYPKSFDVTYSVNHWSNTEKSVDFFNKIVFPYIKEVKKEKGYPKEQMSLVIFDTFKGQDNDTLKKLCADNQCIIVLVPNNLTNKFQPLDLTVNKPAKGFISRRYNTWYATEVEKQLRDGVSPADVKISLRLTRIKELHAKWIYELYEHMKERPEIITNGFEAAGINEAFVNARAYVTRVDNPFRSDEYVVA